MASRRKHRAEAVRRRGLGLPDGRARPRPVGRAGRHVPAAHVGRWLPGGRRPLAGRLRRAEQLRQQGRHAAGGHRRAGLPVPGHRQDHAADLDVPFDKLVVVGGAIRNKFWMQNKADMVGLSIEVPEVEDATPLGAAMLAGIGVGLYRDEQDAFEHVYRPGGDIRARSSGDRPLRRTVPDLQATIRRAGAGQPPALRSVPGMIRARRTFLS